MPAVTVQSGSAPASINLGDGGGTVVNDGPSTVYYNDELPVTTGSTSLASGASVALTGVQFFTADTRASIHFTSSAAVAATASGGVAQGRAIISGVKQYSIPGLRPIDVSTYTLSTGRAQYFPFQCDTSIVIDQIVVELTTGVAASTFRVGIYNADVNWQPTTLVSGTDTGDLTGTIAAQGVIATTISDTTLAAGRYLAWLSTSTGNHVVRCMRGNASQFLGYPPALGANSGFTQTFVSQTYGAPPSTGLAWDTGSVGTATTYSWPVWVRVKTP